MGRFSLCLSQSLLQSNGQLIGAGGALHAALDSGHPVDDVLGLHAFNQSADALQVAVAAADELHVVDLAVLQVEENRPGAGDFGGILVMHCVFSFLCCALFG